MSAHTKEQFDSFMSQLKETNTTLDFYCDFEKINNKVEAISIKLNQLNYLIGQEDIDSAICRLWNENKNVFSILEILIAVRTSDKKKAIMSDGNVRLINTLFDSANDGMTHGEFGLFSNQLAVLGFFQATNVTGMMVVHLLIQLLAGQHDLGSIDDDHVITGIHMGSVDGLVLATQDVGNLAGQAAQHHAVCINDIPLALNVLRICHKGIQVNFLLETVRRIWSSS